MIARAKELFEQIARLHGLRLDWDEKSPVEVAAVLPKQRGLDFKLSLNLQNIEEIGVQTDLFSASWFPFNDPAKQAEFLATVNGLISGEVRIVCSYGPIVAKPYKVLLERHVQGQWKTIYVYRRLHPLLWPTKTNVVVNGRSDT